MPAIEIWEEKGILGYENHTGGLVLLMQMSLNFSFFALKVLLSPRETNPSFKEWIQSNIWKM